MIANERADFVPARGDALACHRNSDGAVVIAQIARLRARGQIDPFTQIRMAQEAIVVFVGVTLDDARLEFPTDAALGPYRAATELSAHDPAFLADITGPFQ